MLVEGVWRDVARDTPGMDGEGRKFPGLYLHELCPRAEPRYTGRVTVPVLWDEKARKIVNNESSEIVRMLNREFDPLARRKLPDLYPEKLRREIDWLNERIYRTVNNGVYRAGFATAQDKYEQAVTELFRTLDWLEKRLKKRRWLCGARFTEADVRLFTTLVRFYYRSMKQINPTQIVPKGPLLDFSLR